MIDHNLSSPNLKNSLFSSSIHAPLDILVGSKISLSHNYTVMYSISLTRLFEAIHVSNRMFYRFRRPYLFHWIFCRVKLSQY